MQVHILLPKPVANVMGIFHDTLPAGVVGGGTHHSTSTIDS